MFVLTFMTLGMYAAVSGFKDGILYSTTGAEAFTWNEQVVFTIERALMCLNIAIATGLSLLDVAVVIVCFALAFSFIHNTAYYYCRAKISKTVFDIKYSSTTSTAKIELKFKARLAGLVLGICGVIAYSAYTAFIVG